MYQQPVRYITLPVCLVRDLGEVLAYAEIMARSVEDQVMECKAEGCRSHLRAVVADAELGHNKRIDVVV